MEAKDTKLELLRFLKKEYGYADSKTVEKMLEEVPQCNPEISFKAGYDKSQGEIISKARQPEAGNYYIEAGHKAGIKEAVEWIENNKEYIHGFPVINAQTWQAKLKEWGVES